MKTRMQRIAAIEKRHNIDPIERAYPGLGAAVDACYAALEAALPHEPGVQVPCPIYSHAYSTVGYKSSWQKVKELAVRLRAGSEAPEDLAVLASLPADALAIVGVDARGFLAMILSLDENLDAEY